MQGVTNAAPPSGGLRIVASGTYEITSTTWNSVFFDEPAKMVVALRQTGAGYCVSLTTFPNTQAAGGKTSSNEEIRARLSPDGYTIYFLDSPGETWYYTAYA